MSHRDKDKVQPMTPQEEKEVHRVFELLSDYQTKSRLREEAKDIATWISSHRKHNNNSNGNGNNGNLNNGNSSTSNGIGINNGHNGSESQDESVAQALQRMDELQRELQAIESKPSTEKRISCGDIVEMFKFLNQKATKKEVEEMLWEVDENLDGYLDWAEVRLMYNRNITDRTGLEPSRMYFLTQFLIYDTNQNGLVSVDETMNLLYARYGRSVMETKLKELFGEDMHEFGRQGGEITFAKFLSSVEKVQLNMFLETNMGRKAKDLQKERK